MFSSNFKGQKYGSLKSKAFKKGELFVDPEFPPSNKSLFFSKVDPDIEWKRPKELCKVPKLLIEGATCDDLNEGELGNTWFVSACSSIACNPKLFAKVVPNVKEQEWTPETPYAGIFHFSFWRFGTWVDVVVDDLLPTKNGKLVFCHSKARNEFWSALLEKAYAKLYGDYETLMSGYAADAMVDFTGGVAEKVDYNTLHLEEEENREKHFQDLLAASENNALIICGMGCPREDYGQETEEGLVKGHGYGVTAVRDIKVNKGMRQVVNENRLQLLRLRNPWGTQEWNGRWSDEKTTVAKAGMKTAMVAWGKDRIQLLRLRDSYGCTKWRGEWSEVSPEWQKLTLRDREEMGITFQAEGEFWMSFEDFLKYFGRLDICHFVNTSIFSLKKTWHESMLHGEWTVGARGTKKDRAGGCEEYPDKFLYNPQYVFDITGATGDTFMVSLEQHDTGGVKMTGQDHHQIGFHIMRVEENRKFRVHIAGEKMWVSAYQRMRSVFERVTLAKGRYVIIPSTREPGISSNYLLRMYTTNNSSTRELVLDCPKKKMCVKGHALVTRVSLKGAEGLQSIKDPNMPPSPLVVVKCEGETYKTGFCRETSNPEWTCNLVFYRKKADQPITVEVYNHKTLIDEFLGIGEITDLSHDTKTTMNVELFGKGKNERGIQKPGKVIMEVESSDDLTAF